MDRSRTPARRRSPPPPATSPPRSVAGKGRWRRRIRWSADGRNASVRDLAPPGFGVEGVGWWWWGGQRHEGSRFFQQRSPGSAAVLPPRPGAWTGGADVSTKRGWRGRLGGGFACASGRCGSGRGKSTSCGFSSKARGRRCSCGGLPSLGRASAPRHRPGRPLRSAPSCEGAPWGRRPTPAILGIQAQSFSRPTGLAKRIGACGWRVRAERRRP